MIHLHYRLGQENLKELNSYLAFHDKKMQKRLLIILGSLSVFIIVLGYLIFRFSIPMLVWSAVGIALEVLCLPKFYWNMVFKRVDHFVETTDVEYSEMDVEIDENIQVKEKRGRLEISFEDIVNFDYTKNNCILFYRDKNRINTLILPVSSFKEEELKKFHLHLMEKK